MEIIQGNECLDIGLCLQRQRSKEDSIVYIHTAIAEVGPVTGIELKGIPGLNSLKERVMQQNLYSPLCSNCNRTGLADRRERQPLIDRFANFLEMSTAEKFDMRMDNKDINTTD